MISRRFFVSACLFLFAFSLFAQKRPDALKLYNAARYDEAIAVCQTEIAQNERNTDSYVVLSWSLVQSGRYDEAEKWAAEGRKIAYYDHRLIEALAEAKYFLGKNEQALALFQEYVSLVPNGSRIASVYYYMGEIFLKLSRYHHADIALTTAVRYENLNAAWWMRLGYARELAKEYRSSVEAYDKALSINPSLADAERGRKRAASSIR